MTQRPVIPVRSPLWWAVALFVVSGTGCGTTRGPTVLPLPVAAPVVQDPEPAWMETPVPEGPWREHHLKRCRYDREVPADVDRLLASVLEYYLDGSGTDGMMELELAIGAGRRHPLLLFALGQLYMMAGQGEPALLPNEGPAADVGSWARNQPRLLGRAKKLLLEVRDLWPDDAAASFLLADVSRAARDSLQAASHVSEGLGKCSGGRNFRLMERYQYLNRYPARYLGGPAPEYPAACLERMDHGEVVLDLLLSPAGEVRQFVVVAAPAPELAEAATVSLGHGAFEAARIGKYPIWSWLRVSTTFRIEGLPEETAP